MCLYATTYTGCNSKNIQTVHGTVTCGIFYRLVIHMPNATVSPSYSQTSTLVSLPFSQVSQIPSSLHLAHLLLCSHALQVPFLSSPLLLHATLMPAKHKAAHYGWSRVTSFLRKSVCTYLRTDIKGQIKKNP